MVGGGVEVFAGLLVPPGLDHGFKTNSPMTTAARVTTARPIQRGLIFFGALGAMTAGVSCCVPSNTLCVSRPEFATVMGGAISNDACGSAGGEDAITVC